MKRREKVKVNQLLVNFILRKFFKAAANTTTLLVELSNFYEMFLVNVICPLTSRTNKRLYQRHFPLPKV